MSNNIYEIRDPIFGFITFNEWEREIINSKEFQRLRRIKQLAFTDMIYPGANHTRFEHSLGVMHMATMMYDSITSKNSNFEILKRRYGYDKEGIGRDRQLVRLAALLHDIGHTPFSHGPECLLPNEHEEYSVKIIKDSLKDIIENHKINDNYKIKAEEVAALIEGNIKVLKGRIFWRVLISSQLDADRCDYLLRDSYHTGVKYGIYDYNRLINTISIGIDPEEDDVVLGIEEGGWRVAEALIIARYLIFTQVYLHKTRMIYDYHLTKILENMLPNGKFPTPNEINDYLNLDDYKVWNFILSNENSIEDCFYILNRKHHRMIYEVEKINGKGTQNIVQKIKDMLKKEKIWYHEEGPRDLKEWYIEEENKEIMIINEYNNKANPLSKWSNVTKYLGKYDFIRLYVKYNDVEKARIVVDEVLK